MHGSIQIKSFETFADSVVTGIKCLYLSKDEFLKEPSDVESAPEIPSTLEIYNVTRVFNDDNICKLNFLKLLQITNPIMSNGIDVKATPKYVIIPSFLSFLTHKIPAQHAENYTQRKKIGQNVKFANNGFTNNVS